METINIKQKENPYEGMRPAQIVTKCAVPAMLAMVMVLIYNLADAFFIGLTGNASMVAAVSVATPVFLIFMCVGTLFGVGGTSVIARAMGAGLADRARKTSAFCFWCCMASGVVLSAGFLIFMEPVLGMIGTSDGTYAYVRTYLTIVAFSAPFSVISNCFSNILRAEGEATKAMVGTCLGNFLNIVLDGVLVIFFDMGVEGVAIATVIGNAVAALYYIFFYLRGKSRLSIDIRDFSAEDGIGKDVLAIGIPASFNNILMSVSTVLLNAQMSGCGDLQVAAIGVTMRIMLIIVLLMTGFGMGVQPVIGYFYGAGERERFHSVFKLSLTMAFTVSSVLTVICYIFAPQLVGAFLSDEGAYTYCLTFTYINLASGFVTGLSFVLINSLQAMGAALPSLFLSVCRQGVVFIPSLFIFKAYAGMYGLVCAQPFADIVSFLISAAVYVIYSKKVIGKQSLKYKKLEGDYI